MVRSAAGARSTRTCCLPAIMRARQASRSRAGSTTRRPAGTTRPGRCWCRPIPSPPSMGASATTRANPPAIAPSSTAPSASTPSNASSVTWPSNRAGRSRQARPRPGRTVLVVGAGPSGLSAAYHLRRLGHDVVVRDAGPVAGGMMHFGIPAYRLPRTILDAEVQRLADMGVVFEFNHKVTRPRIRVDRRRLRGRLPRRGRASRQASGHSGARRGPHARRPRLSEGRRGRHAAEARTPGGRLRRRQHRDGRRAHGRPARIRAAHHLPPRSRSHARARGRSRRRPRGGREDPLAAVDRRDGGRRADGRSDGARRAGAGRTARASSRRSRPTRSSSLSGQDTDTTLPQGRVGRRR